MDQMCNIITCFHLKGAGTSSSANHYRYSDFGFEKKLNYYRLKQTDYDNKSETFDLISINNSQSHNNIVKIINILGQEVEKDYTGIRIIYFDNGEIKKVYGKHIPN